MLEPKLIDARYEVVKRLGGNSHSAVFECLDKNLDRRVAVKAVAFPEDRDKTAEERIAERFRREVFVTGNVPHRHVIKVFDRGRDNEAGLFYMTMELLEGRTLAAELSEDGAPDPEAALKIIVSLADTLGTLHEKGVRHRALRPEHVFIHRGEPVLLDFADATIQGREQTFVDPEPPTLGPWTSPEEIPGGEAAEDPGARADVWALGLIARELCLGKPLFDKKAGPREIAATLADPETLLDEIEDDLGEHPLAELVMAILDSQAIDQSWMRFKLPEPEPVPVAAIEAAVLNGNGVNGAAEEEDKPSKSGSWGFAVAAILMILVIGVTLWGINEYRQKLVAFATSNNAGANWEANAGANGQIPTDRPDDLTVNHGTAEHEAANAFPEEPKDEKVWDDPAPMIPLNPPEVTRSKPKPKARPKAEKKKDEPVRISFEEMEEEDDVGADETPAPPVKVAVDIEEDDDPPAKSTGSTAKPSTGGTAAKPEEKKEEQSSGELFSFGSAPKKKEEKPAEKPAEQPKEETKPGPGPAEDARPSTPKKNFRYRLQAGTYSKLSNAENVKLRLERLGMFPLIRKVERSSGAVYIVMLNTYNDEEEAEARRADLRAKGFDASITVLE